MARLGTERARQRGERGARAHLRERVRHEHRGVSPSTARRRRRRSTWTNAASLYSSAAHRVALCGALGLVPRLSTCARQPQPPNDETSDGTRDRLRTCNEHHRTEPTASLEGGNERGSEGGAAMAFCGGLCNGTEHATPRTMLERSRCLCWVASMGFEHQLFLCTICTGHWPGCQVRGEWPSRPTPVAEPERGRSVVLCGGTCWFADANCPAGPLVKKGHSRFSILPPALTYVVFVATPPCWHLAANPFCHHLRLTHGLT